jgi:hypothetical protein
MENNRPTSRRLSLGTSLRLVRAAKLPMQAASPRLTAWIQSEVEASRQKPETTEILVKFATGEPKAFLHSYPTRFPSPAD